MPLRLDSITSEANNVEIFAWILQDAMNTCNSAIVTKDRKYVHIRTGLIDSLSNREIGKIVYTLAQREQSIEVLDVDLVWNNERQTTVLFDSLLEGSSDSNEYYEVELVDDMGGHLETETVNRYAYDGDLLDSTRTVFASAFPFELAIFEDMKELDRWVGFDQANPSEDSQFRPTGLSERFVMPCSAFREQGENKEYYSFVVGTVVSFSDVEIQFGEVACPFVLANVDTALGIIPVSMSREVFDLSKLKNGCVVGMYANIKADIAKEEDFVQG